MTYQYNAARDINLGAVQNRDELVTQLEKLQVEVAKAQAAGALTEEAATDAADQLTKAVQQVKKPEPDKHTLLDHLTRATQLVTGTVGLADALATAAEKVHALL